MAATPSAPASSPTVEVDGEVAAGGGGSSPAVGPARAPFAVPIGAGAPWLVIARSAISCRHPRRRPRGRHPDGRCHPNGALILGGSAGARVDVAIGDDTVHAPVLAATTWPGHGWLALLDRDGQRIALERIDGAAGSVATGALELDDGRMRSPVTSATGR